MPGDANPPEPVYFWPRSFAASSVVGNVASAVLPCEVGALSPYCLSSWRNSGAVRPSAEAPNGSTFW